MRLGHTAINGPPSTSDAGRLQQESTPPWSARRDPAVGDDLSGELRRGVAGEIEHETHQVVRSSGVPDGDGLLHEYFEAAVFLWLWIFGLAAQFGAETPAGHDGIDAHLVLGGGADDLTSSVAEVSSEHRRWRS